MVAIGKEVCMGRGVGGSYREGEKVVGRGEGGSYREGDVYGEGRRW